MARVDDSKANPGAPAHTSAELLMEDAFDAASAILAPQAPYLANQPHPVAAVRFNGEELYAPSYEFFALLTWSVFLSLLTSIVTASLYQRWSARLHKVLSPDEVMHLKQQLLEELRRSDTRQVGPMAVPEQVRRTTHALLREHGWPEAEATRAIDLMAAELYKLASSIRGGDDFSADVGIVIALKEEFSVLFEDVRGQATAHHKPELTEYYYTFERPGPPGSPSYRCVATFMGEMGPTRAALATERLIQHWAPESIAMLGIAAGIHPDLKLGDVVAVTQIDSYLEAVKAVGADTASGFQLQHAGEVYRAPQDMVSILRNLEFSHSAGHERWSTTCAAGLTGSVAHHADLVAQGLVRQRPQLQDAHIASGPIVGAARGFVEWLHRRDRSCKALEMEAGGLMAAAHTRAGTTRTLVLRGISDFGDERKQELDRLGGGALRQYAMRNATRLLWTLLEEGLLPRARVYGERAPAV
jgi:nucleoside phosphorylase